MRLEHHLVGGYVHYISPHIIIIITVLVMDERWTRQTKAIWKKQQHES